MAKISKAQVDKNLRDRVFQGLIGVGENDSFMLSTGMQCFKINDRQWGTILTDLNGHQRYIRIGAIVAEERDDMTAEELMKSEMDAYQTKQDEKEIKRLKKEAKIEKDKARRKAEAEAKAKEE